MIRHCLVLRQFLGVLGLRVCLLCLTCIDTSHQKPLCKSSVENLIISYGLLVSIVDNDGFRKFMSDVDPRLKCHDIKRTVISPLNLRCFEIPLIICSFLLRREETASESRSERHEQLGYGITQCYLPWHWRR